MAAPNPPRSNDPKGDLRWRWLLRDRTPARPAPSRKGYTSKPQPRATTNLGRLLRKAGVDDAPEPVACLRCGEGVPVKDGLCLPCFER